MTLPEIEAYCEAMDRIDRPSVPVFIYAADLYAELAARYDDFGACSIRGHRIVWMAPQGTPPNAKRTYVNDVQGVAPTKKRNRTKWSPNATKASSLF